MAFGTHHSIVAAASANRHDFNLGIRPSCDDPPRLVAAGLLPLSQECAASLSFVFDKRRTPLRQLKFQQDKERIAALNYLSVNPK
jgi:hypothetical protein